MNESPGFPMVAAKVKPPLDPDFRPAVLANQNFRRLVDQSGTPVPVEIALERSSGSVSRFAFMVLPKNHPAARANDFYLERLVKFLLWSRGGATIHVAGPRELAEQLSRHYQNSETGRFDASLMGERIYESPFRVLHTPPENLPPENEPTRPLGGHLNGCRIGFDLGASDRKVAAVLDGTPVFSEEVPWDPKPVADPAWHFDRIMDSLRRAARKLPRVDAIGGSSAGVYVNNRVQVASLFRGVSADRFESRVKNLFLEIQSAWNGIPFEIVNDGEVTALAGAMALKANAVLGVAMGSSEAAGYVTPEGGITPWLNELAFAPIDYNPNAPVDEWSGDFGCGAQYFSQQAVGRLLNPAGIELSETLSLPEKLIQVQDMMSAGDARAEKIYRTIGTYFGYAIPHYAEFYDFRYLLVLGRVTSGPGGEVILQSARNVLDTEFPELSKKIRFHVPGETEKRHGQAVAAASLPIID